MQKPQFRDYFLLHLCIVFWGFTSVLGVLSTLEASYIVFYRTGLSFVTLMFINYLRAGSNQLPSKNRFSIVIAGILTAVHWTTFFASAKMSSVSTCLAGISTTALWTSLLEPIFTKKKFQWMEMVLAIFVSFGLVLIYRSDFSLAPGLIVSLISAIACSCFTIINRTLVAHHSPLTLTTWEMFFAFIFSILVIPILHFLGLMDSLLFEIPDGWEWLNILFLAWACTVFAYTMSIELMKKFTAFEINLTVNLEPVYGIALGIIVFGQKEKMGNLFYVGLAIILAGVFIFPLLEKIKKPR